MALYERYPNGPTLLHHHLMDGAMFAEPTITFDGQMVMTIIGWNFDDGCESVLDQKSMFNGFETVHHIPVRVLDCAFYVPTLREGMRFTEGGLYHRTGDWTYPFYGDRLCAWVKRYDGEANGNANTGGLNVKSGESHA